MTKLKKYFLRFICIPLLCYVVLTSALSVLFKDKLVQIVHTEIEKNVSTPVQIGDIKLSFLTAFPFAELRVKDIYIEDRWEKTLLDADLLGIRIGLFSLLTDGIKIQSVIVKGGKANVVYNKKGVANYDIFNSKSDDSASDNSDFKLRIRKGFLEEMNIRYIDQREKHDIKLAIQDLNIGGDFSSQVFDLATSSLLVVEKLKLSNQTYFKNKPLSYLGNIKIDLEQERYQIETLDINIDGGAFDIAGSIEQEEKETILDLALNASNGDLGAVLALLPDLNAADFRTSGDFAFNATVKGPYSDKSMPAIEVAFGLEDGEISTSYLDLPLKHVSFKSAFIMGHPKKTSTLNVDGFYAEMGGAPILFDLNILDLDNPLIDFRADAQIAGKAIAPFVGEGVRSSGTIDLNDIYVKGRLSDMKRIRNAKRVEASGSMELNTLSFTKRGTEVQFDSGLIKLRNNRLDIPFIEVQGDGMEAVGKGYIANYLAFLTSDNQSSPVQMNFDLEGEELDINSLLAILNQDETEDIDEELLGESEEAYANSTSNNFSFLRQIKGVFTADLKAVQYEDLAIDQFEGRIDFKQGDIRIKGDLETMEGQMTMDGAFNVLASRPILTLKVDCESINASEMFRQMDNFGQDMITEYNVSGDLHSKLVMILPFEADGGFDPNDLRVYAGIGIEDGELKGIEMLEDFSKIIHINDLRNIRFVNMENWLEISNGQVYIPAMFLQSNAINLRLSGVQGFDEKIDYSLKVNAGQVLAEKVKRHDIELNPIAAKEHGFFNLYFNIFGDLDDMDYKTSKRIVNEQFMASESRKMDVRYALEKAFGPIELIAEPKQWADLGDFELPEDMEEEVEYIDGF